MHKPTRVPVIRANRILTTKGTLGPFVHSCDSQRLLGARATGSLRMTQPGLLPLKFHTIELYTL